MHVVQTQCMYNLIITQYNEICFIGGVEMVDKCNTGLDTQHRLGAGIIYESAAGSALFCHNGCDTSRGHEWVRRCNGSGGERTGSYIVQC